MNRKYGVRLASDFITLVSEPLTVMIPRPDLLNGRVWMPVCKK